ncbi:MAG: CBS domain-containing protein [Sulfolobales archaeon]
MNCKILVEENLIRRIPSLKEKDLATKARALMRDLGLRILVVTDDIERVVGVVWRESILAITSSRSNLLIKDLMSESQIIGFHNECMIDLVRKMLDHDVWYSPIVNSSDNKRYVGVFGLETFIERIIRESDISAKLRQIRVSDIMTRDIVTVSPNTFISTVWRYMIKYRFAGFPVVNERNIVIGIITQHDLLRANISFQSESGPRRGPRVISIMTRPAITIGEDSDLLEASEIMIKRDIGRIPVVARDGVIRGIIDRSDVAREIIRLLG